MFFCDYPILRGEQELPVFLVNMGQHTCQDHISRPEGYPFDQILYCTKGSGTLFLDGKKISIRPCTALYLPKHYPHEYSPDGDVWDIHWIVPSGYGCEKILSQFGLTEPCIFQIKEINMLEHIFRKMHDSLRSDSVFGNYRASGYLYDFLIEFYRVTSEKVSSVSTSSALMKAVDYINSNYSDTVTMDELCSVSGVTKQHLCLLFRKSLDTRPMEYIAKRRIQAAKELLMSTDKNVEEIAEETGFGGSSYFCKLFRKYEGITPTQFRTAG